MVGPRNVILSKIWMAFILKNSMGAAPARADMARQPGHTRAIAALVFIGIAVPPLGDLLKPFVTEAIFLLLCVSFMRVDVGALRDHLRRPAIVIAATAWTTLAVPAIIGVIFHLGGLDVRLPDLYLALMLQGVASPMMAAPSLAALMGLDATLVLVTLVTSTAIVPFTPRRCSPRFSSATALTLSPSALGLKLAAILTGSLLVAGAIRMFAGASAIERHKLPIDGFQYPGLAHLRRGRHG